MKKSFIVIFTFCLSYSFSVFSQSFTSKTSIWYDSEQESIYQTQNNSTNKNNLQKITSKQDEDSVILLNFNTVKHFNTEMSSMQTEYDISRSSRLSVIVVFHASDTLSEHGIWSVTRDGKQITGLTDRRLLRQKSEYKYPIKRRGIPLINTSMQAFSKIRNKADSNYFVLGEATLPDSTLSSFSGNIAECLVFNRFLKKSEALKIETYLAIKYGITLIESDYLSPSDVILWTYEENKEYSNGIAGLGRDSVFGLKQKQGCSSEEEDLLTISVGNFNLLNKNNNFTLSESNYLIWGHNDRDLAYNDIACDEAYPLLERKWLIQTTYTNSNTIFPTTVKLQLPEEYRDSTSLCYLAIDRSGVGNFTSASVEYIVQNQIDTSGYVYFDNVVWDMDGSGKDMFTFSFGYVVDLMANPSCSNTSTGSIVTEICGGKTPFDYLLTHDSSSQQFQYQGDRNYTFENLPAGLYTLTITDSNLVGISQQIEITEFPDVLSSLPLNYAIQDDSNIVNASDYFGTSAMSYVWEKDSAFFSNNSSVNMSSKGSYKLIATDTNGCIYTFYILAEENLLSQRHKSTSSSKGQMSEALEQEAGRHQYKVYPNPTMGKYNIEVDLPEESPVIVRVFTANGSLLETWKDSHKTRYYFESYISTIGNYIVEIETVFETKDFKLVVIK